MDALKLKSSRPVPGGAKALAALALLCLAQAAGLGAAGAQSNLLIHGNFCGPGNRGPGYPPVDALDLACARHDACSPDFGSGLLPTCACNRRLQVEAGSVARDPYTPQATRQTAQFVSDFAASLPCR